MDQRSIQDKPLPDPEETMGHTLYNTIHLGRGPLYYSRWAQLALALGVAASAGLGWLALRALR